MLSERKSFRKTIKKARPLSIEQKVENFILRNSDNGFFTKVSTIPYKFEISEDKAWDIVGELLADGSLESVHDEFTGDMKLCRTGRMYSVMDSERKRKKTKPFKRKQNAKKHDISKR